MFDCVFKPTLGKGKDKKVHSIKKILSKTNKMKGEKAIDKMELITKLRNTNIIDANNKKTEKERE